MPPLAIEERTRDEEGHAQENADPESHAGELSDSFIASEHLPNPKGLFPKNLEELRA